MPKLLDDNMENIKLPGGGNFQFSAVRPDNLGAMEYTLVTVVGDDTGSVSSFVHDLAKCPKEIIKACKKSPRAENLLIRFVLFSEMVKEVHGFKLLSMINPDDYDSIWKTNGGTALFDATYESIEATLTYSKTLIDNDFSVNGAIYIITDGDDNRSRFATPNMIKTQMSKAKKAEDIESLITILIGINTNGMADSRTGKTCGQLLEEFKKEANLTQFIDVGEATPQKLAKLADFVSRSISSQSQSFGKGPSQPLTF